jgi:hypothetical protein
LLESPLSIQNSGLIKKLTIEHGQKLVPEATAIYLDTSFSVYKEYVHAIS